MSRRQGGLDASLRTDLAWTLAIGGLSLLWHVIYAVQFGRHPLGEQLWVDEGAYHSRALEILSGRWLPRQPFYQDPLFPYALAGIIRLVGSDVPVVRLVLALLGSLTPVVVFWAGKRGLGRAEGALAGLALAACAPLVFTDGLIEKEGLAALAAALGLGCAARAAVQPRALSWAALTGLCWAAVALLRANALLVAPLGACWFSFGFGQTTLPRRIFRCIGFLAGFGLPLAPVVGVNFFSATRPDFMLTTWQLGPNFYIGNGPDATGTYAAPPFLIANPAHEADNFRAEAQRRSRHFLSPGEVSTFWLKEGLKQWRQAPGKSAKLLLWKLLLVGHDFEIPDSQNLEVVRLVASPALGLCALSFGCLIPWAAVGLFRQPRTPFWWFLVVTTAAGLLSTAVFFVVGRYRIPWIPGLALLAAAGIVDLWERARDRRWRSLAARVGLVALPAALLAWWPIPDPAPDRWGHAEIELALAYLADYQLDPTMDAFDDARALGSGPAGRVNELLSGGPVHDRLAHLISAAYSRESQFEPVPELLRAHWLRQLPEGRVESRRLLEKAVLERPDDAVALREWGAWWLGELHNPEARAQALAHLHQAALGRTGDPVAAGLLALASHDAAPLDWPAGRRNSAASPRVRLTRAIVTAPRGP